ncbi:lycopene cyclase family protein, partial [Streptomyces spongiae]|uniref:lycopene cyclase family protein n=1 Tax=Streptomyces spongiae TaxID=565072 RepID=UPI002AD2D8D0
MARIRRRGRAGILRRSGTAGRKAEEDFEEEDVVESDIVIVGGGAAGLSLAHRLPTDTAQRPAVSVVLVDALAEPLRAPRRTWCFWEEGTGRYDSAVTASWEWLRVHSRHGAALRRHIAPLRYKMIRSGDFEALVEHDLAERPRIRRLHATVHDVALCPDGTGATYTGAGRRATGVDALPAAAGLRSAPAKYALAAR